MVDLLDDAAIPAGDDTALLSHLGPDLMDLVQGVGVPLAGALRITGLPSRVLTHAAFLLDFGDGRRLKGRRLDDATQAERVAALVGSIDLPALPRVLARRGVALLEEWVTGVPLDHRHATREGLRRAGALLGAIHRAVSPASCGNVASPSPQERLHVTDGGLAELTDLGLLPAAGAERLRMLVHAHVPERPEVGVVHRDFCSENLVLDASGAPHVVDNETLAIDAYDFDLARTWYRWPMTPVERQAFEAGYATCRPLERSDAHALFWRVVVLVDAALFRHHAKTAGLSVPIRRLLEIQSTPADRAARCP